MEGKERKRDEEEGMEEDREGGIEEGKEGRGGGKNLDIMQ